MKPRSQEESIKKQFFPLLNPVYYRVVTSVGFNNTKRGMQQQTRQSLFQTCLRLQEAFWYILYKISLRPQDSTILFTFLNSETTC